MKLESWNRAPEGKPAGEAAWMALTLANDGIITAITRTSEQLTGFELREVIGQPVTCILADRSVFEISRMLDEASESGFWSGKISHRDKNGAPVNGSCTLMALSDDRQRRSGYLLFSTFGIPLQMAGNADASSIGGRLRAFAHEMNNPLAVIMGMAQLMLLNPQLQGRARSDMDKLYSEIQRVIHVTERLHSYAISLQQDEFRHAG